MLFDVKNGGSMLNGTKGALYFFGTHKDTENRESAYVFEGIGPGQGTSVSRGEVWFTEQAGSVFTGLSLPFTEDAGYVKLRELSVSYTLRNQKVQRLGLSSIDLRLSGRNLKTWTKYTGIDPESNLTGPSNLRGFEYFNLPNTRSYVLTLRLNY
jgi:hypothetical protein